MLMNVRFHAEGNDRDLKYAVIVSRAMGQWVFCKHRARDTYECPGGHREPGENILETAKRELYEETGALDYALTPVCCIDSVTNAESGEHSSGLLCYAEIKTFGPLPELEMERIELFEELPERWTYPEIQPYLVEWVQMFLAR
ncbi:MAG: NUDIX hydrolase [Oscillospiraceae bacterium]|jgi:8-oxo-dGTP diphosphatase